MAPPPRSWAGISLEDDVLEDRRRSSSTGGQHGKGHVLVGASTWKAAFLCGSSRVAIQNALNALRTGGRFHIYEYNIHDLKDLETVVEPISGLSHRKVKPIMAQCVYQGTKRKSSVGKKPIIAKPNHLTTKSISPAPSGSGTVRSVSEPPKGHSKIPSLKTSHTRVHQQENYLMIVHKILNLYYCKPKMHVHHAPPDLTICMGSPAIKATNNEAPPCS